jgi:peptidoglycan/LPS O-acetylase OafA/YrhL
MTASRNHALDSLRGLAALSVVIFHVWVYARPVPGSVFGSPADFALNEARLGLILFFALSGFLLYRPWVRAALRGTASPRIGSYLVRRAGRILPAYYVAIAGAALLLWGASATPGVDLPPASGLPLFAVFAQNYSMSTAMTLDPPTWTLAVEVSFYLTLPLIGLAAARLGRSRQRQLVLPLALIAGGLAWNTFTSPALPYGHFLPAALPYFGAGMLAGVLVEERSISRRWGFWLLVAGSGAVLLDAALHSGACPAALTPFVAQTLRNSLSAAGFAAIVAAVACGPRTHPLLNSRPLVALGTISYGVYLWHLPLLLALRSQNALPLQLLPALAVVLSVTIAVAALSWLLVEKPILAWAHRVTRRGSTPGGGSKPALAQSTP